MADAYPKKILPELEGKIGELRIMRFWSKIDMRGPDECWEWQASLNLNGYGRFKLGSYNMVIASRLALICTSKSEPDGLLALHHCDNPKCCNPDHLYWGTVKDNARDKVERGRAYVGNQSGANNGHSKITDAQLATIILRFREGWSNTKIAADLPIGHSMVSKIRRGHLWREQCEALGWHGAPDRRHPVKELV
jgi:hypothetical protein